MITSDTSDIEIPKMIAVWLESIVKIKKVRHILWLMSKSIKDKR